MKSLTAAAVLCGAATAHAFPTAITLDGYCDGITDIVFNRSTGMMTGTYDVMSCGFPENFLAVGLSGPNRRDVGGVTGHYTAPWMVGTTIRINVDNTWVYYSKTGEISNGGTWSDASSGRQATGSTLSTWPH